jgi:hypothetical protein
VTERVHAAFSSIDPGLLDPGVTAPGANVQVGFNERFASLGTADTAKFVSAGRYDASEPGPAGTAFGERFAFEQTAAADEPSLAFNDRFASNFDAAAATPRGNVQRVAAAALVPRARPSEAPQRMPARIQLASASATSLPLSFAPTDAVKTSAMGDLKELTPKKPRGEGDRSRTAIYDISARTVYLPNGRRLEAHSGFGDHMDDVRYADKRMTGPTPPNLYDLKLREAPFKGTRAIRLIPTDNSKMHGRAGILAHPYLLGPTGQSNGCVSIKDYDAFVAAFDRGEIDRIMVVDRLGDPPPNRTAADWLRDLFRS